MNEIRNNPFIVQNKKCEIKGVGCVKHGKSRFP